jgi:hypothetical protein
MKMYVKWDHENNEILVGPQGVAISGEDNWYPYLELGILDRVNDGQTIVTEFDETRQSVIKRVDGEFRLNYADARRDEYPNIGEQLDALWHDIENNTLNKNGNFFTVLKAVKDKHPKT